MNNTNFPHARFTGRTALVVDDGMVERGVGKALLEKLGFQVQTAADGAEALGKLDLFAADLVLCDISMPGMDGLALLEATRAARHRPLFIMATSYDDAHHVQACAHRGAAACLTKPLRFDALAQAISALLCKTVS